MNIRLMRNIDRFVGIPLCWLLSCILWLVPERKQRPLKNVLVIKCFGMGSIILSSAALRLLRSSYPDAHIDFMTFKSNRELVQRYPVVDGILTADTKNLKNFIRDTYHIINHIFKANYDVVFDFEFFSKFSTLLSGISRANYRIGFALPTQWRRRLLTHQIALRNDVHVSKSFCKQVFLVTGKITPPEVSPPLVYIEDVESMKGKLPIDGTPAIAINVGVSDTFLERRWLPERFAELVDCVSQKYEGKFYFIGLEHQRKEIQHVIDMTSCKQRCFNIAGGLTFPELAAFLRHCCLLISADSGPLHLASVLGTKTIGLFGPESPDFYGPVNISAATIYKGAECSPCMNIYRAKTYRCPHQAKCMRAIGTWEVVARTEEALMGT